MDRVRGAGSGLFDTISVPKFSFGNFCNYLLIFAYINTYSAEQKSRLTLKTLPLIFNSSPANLLLDAEIIQQSRKICKVLEMLLVWPCR
jgi:hypothetical protein